MRNPRTDTKKKVKASAKKARASAKKKAAARKAADKKGSKKKPAKKKPAKKKGKKIKTPIKKKCCTCGKVKQVKTKDGTNFWKNAKSPDGLRAQCKQCFYDWRNAREEE